MDSNEPLPPVAGSNPSFPQNNKKKYPLIKFQNSKVNREALVKLGYIIHDPHFTFNRKAWIIFSNNSKPVLLGVNRRNNFKQITVEDFINQQQ